MYKMYIYTYCNFDKLSSSGYFITTGGPYESFEYMAISQLVSAPLSLAFTSLPHCINFRFKLFSSADTELVLATYVSVGGQLNNQNIYWKSVDASINTWTSVKVTIGVTYYDYIVFEVRRNHYTSNLIKVGLDDISVSDGLCL